MTTKLPSSSDAVYNFNTVSSETLAYLAGVVDSDGCISINKFYDPKHPTRSPRYVLNIVVVNTSLRLMNWLADNFGGTFKERRKVSEAHKTTYSWQYTNSKAASLLELIHPYLVEKFDRASNGIAFIREGRGLLRAGSLPVPTEELERREVHYQIGKMLNQTGPVQPQRLNLETPSGEKDDAIV